MPDSLGDRMKGYEQPYKYTLPRRLPVILRVDGKAFHGLTRDLQRPFDSGFADLMDATAAKLCNEAQGAVFAFVQSDEISVLLHNYKRLNSGAWFENELQKMCSVGASTAAGFLSARWRECAFDARVFVLPEAEVCNYFIWRQQDATRNSVQMATRSVYSHREVDRKNNTEMQEMLFAKGINWNDYPVGFKRGRAVVREVYSVSDGAYGAVERHRWVSQEPPIFTEDRWYVEQHLKASDDQGSHTAQEGE